MKIKKEWNYINNKYISTFYIGTGIIFMVLGSFFYTIGFSSGMGSGILIGQGWVTFLLGLFFYLGEFRIRANVREDIKCNR